jgi:hypothetical protein
MISKENVEDNVFDVFILNLRVFLCVLGLNRNARRP